VFDIRKLKLLLHQILTRTIAEWIPG
jgi:hypothetical protein